MALSAQQKFNEFLAENRKTSEAVMEFVSSSRDKHGNYSHACGYLESVVKELIAELPKARREQMREQFRRDALKIRKEIMVDTLSI